jgi:hypothetical protein
MPYFYDYPNDKDFGKIAVTPKGIVRRFIKVGKLSLLPYVKMGRIRFTLHVERLPQDVGSNRPSRNVYVQAGDGSYRVITTIDKQITDIEGIAEYTGDIKFLIASAGYSDRNAQRFIAAEGILLFDDHVLSINHYIYGGASLVVLLFSFLCILFGWLLGFIELMPFWRIGLRQ